LKAFLIRQFAEFILFIGQSNITKHIYIELLTAFELEENVQL